MTTSQSIRALRRANPRDEAGFEQTVEATDALVRARLAAAPGIAVPRRAGRPRRLGGLAAASAVVAVATAAFLVVGPSVTGPGVEDATAAVQRAATLTAAAVERSGTAAVRITHGGEPWAGKTIRWNGADLAVTREVTGQPGRAGGELRVVDGTMYGPDPRGSWIVLGSPASIDPGSGTTPDEYLAAVREDVGGVTLHRITGGMTDLATAQVAGGATVYSGTVAASVLARETGFKEGRPIRVLPFGYVAHDEASDPNAALDAAITVGADGIVREIAVTWGAGASAWRYAVSYSGLGSTPSPTAPANARPFPDRAVERGATAGPGTSAEPGG
jgi:hypothetical protein